MYCSVQCSEKSRLQCSVEFIERCAVECSVQEKVAVASPGPKVGGVGRCSRRVAGSGPALHCTLCNVHTILHSVNGTVHCKLTTQYTLYTRHHSLHSALHRSGRDQALTRALGEGRLPGEKGKLKGLRGLRILGRNRSIGKTGY